MTRLTRVQERMRIMIQSQKADPKSRVDKVTLQGRYVVLEPLRTEHVDELFPAAGEQEIWTFMSMKVQSRDDLARWISRRVEAAAYGTALAFIQRDAKTGEAFGSTSLFEIDLSNRRAEIGHTWIDASHRRTAVNTEAKLLILSHAFEGLSLLRVQIKTAPENLRSRKAIERLGAKYEGHVRNYLVYDDGSTHDRVIYSVILEEWPSVREHLEALLAQNR